MSNWATAVLSAGRTANAAVDAAAVLRSTPIGASAPASWVSRPLPGLLAKRS